MKKSSGTSFLSLRRLAWEIGVPADTLRALALGIRKTPAAHYKYSRLEMGKDKVRHIDNPAPALKEVQRRLVSRILAPLGFGEAAHGGVRGRSQETNAKVHQGRRCVVKMDVKSFFPSVQHKRVYRMFRHEHGFGRDVAHLMTRLVTLRGGLPQGAPTSPAVANHFARSIDERLKPCLDAHQLRCTRFIDDFTISGDRPELLIDYTERLLKAKGLRSHPKKLNVSPRGGKQEVTGLVVNHDGRLSVSRAYRDAVRSSVHKLRALPEVEWAKEVESIKGKLNYIERYNKGSAERLRRYLSEVTGGDPFA